MAQFIWRDSKTALKAVDVTDFADGDFCLVTDSGIEYGYVYNSAGTGGDTDTYIDATTGAGGWEMQLLPPINIGSVSDIDVASAANKHQLFYDAGDEVWHSALGNNFDIVYNGGAGTITQGTLVTITSSAAGYSVVVAADKDTHDHASGIAIEDIGAATVGMIQIQGKLQESWVNTLSLTGGSTIYVGSSGALIDTAPTTGAIIPIGVVGAVAAANGSYLLDMPSSQKTASGMYYDNSTSGLAAETSQDAIDEINAKVPQVDLTLTTTAANNFSAGSVGYISSAGTVTLADASAEATAKNMLVMATDSISGGASGTFVRAGDVTVTAHGFTLGVPLYLSETAGALTTTAPTTAGAIVRVVGYAVDANTIYLRDDSTYVEIQ